VKIAPKIYKISKNKNYVKANNLLFFLNGTNVKSGEWVKTEQKLKINAFNYSKIFNSSLLIAFKKSVYCNIKSSIISSLILFVMPKDNKKVLKKKFFFKLELLNLIILALNLNNKIYSVLILKKITSFIYYSNTLILYKFLVAIFKKSSQQILISK
jgi:hypothetical protein